MIPQATLKLLLLATFLCVAGLLAFWRRDVATIRKYTVERPAPRDRMLAAIIPRGEQAWFLKLTGPVAEMASQVEPFRRLIESIRFGEAPTASPTWTLPAGWANRGPSPMRFATLEAGASKLECSVTVLPKTGGALSDYLVANINRWRDQMRVSQIGRDELESTTQQIELEGTLTATLVDLRGELAGGVAGAGSGMGVAPVAPASSKAGSTTSTPDNKRVAAKSDLKYIAPKEWVPGELVVSRGGITVPREAAFEVRDGGSVAEITVTRMPAGVMLDNINRWRGQIGLGALTNAQYQETKRDIEFAGGKADYVQFFGARDAILGVVATQGTMAWFVKLQGPAELAGRERQRFEDFVRSIRVGE